MSDYITLRTEDIADLIPPEYPANAVGLMKWARERKSFDLEAEEMLKVFRLFLRKKFKGKIDITKSTEIKLQPIKRYLISESALRRIEYRIKSILRRSVYE